MLYSTSYVTSAESKLIRQAAWVVAGGLGAAVVRLADYRTLARWSGVLLCLAGLALAYLALASFLHGRIPQGVFARIPFVAAEPTKGSFRWLRFFGFSLQPSEFAKILLILFLAAYYQRNARFSKRFVPGVLVPFLAAGGVIGLILLGRDLSTSVITGAVVMCMAFVAGVQLRYLVLGVLAGVLLVGAMIAANPERMARLMTYQNPETHRYDDGYQLWASQLALGSGNWSGLGFTNSRMKQQYLPEASTDFIVAIVGEELGYVAVLGLLVGYAAITVCIIWIGCLASDRTGLLLCTGVGLLIGIQALVNISVVSGFCPTTGVTAPFVSYGGSSMLAGMLGIGLVFSVLRVAQRGRDQALFSEPIQVVDTPTLRTRSLAR
jgi:cell division protein FtsW